MKNAMVDIAYKGAKERYILDIEDKELTNKVIEILNNVTQIPIKKTKTNLKTFNIFEIFYGKEKREIYLEFKQIEDSIDFSNDLYDIFDEISKMIYDNKDYIRLRGFRLICKLSKWDTYNKIDNIIEEMLNLLYSDKPTIVRQCLSYLTILVSNKPKYKKIIKQKVSLIKNDNFKETMSPLIANDIKKILQACK